MRRYTNSRVLRALLVFAATVTAFSALGRGGTLPTPGEKSPDLPPNAGPDGYRQIVQDQCVIHWTQHNDPSPCEKVFLADPNGDGSGYALPAEPHRGGH